MSQSTYNKFREALFASSGEVEREIKELKFGCKVLDQTGEWLVLNGRRQKSVDGGYEDIIYCYNYTSCSWIKYFEIIGRDITLEDCLRAMENKLTEAGIFTKDTYYSCFGDIISVWTLGKPAQNQSDETLIQITKLLQ